MEVFAILGSQASSAYICNCCLYKLHLLGFPDWRLALKMQMQLVVCFLLSLFCHLIGIDILLFSKFFHTSWTFYTNHFPFANSGWRHLQAATATAHNGCCILHSAHKRKVIFCERCQSLVFFKVLASNMLEKLVITGIRYCFCHLFKHIAYFISDFVLLKPFLSGMQCCNVSIRHDWEITFVQKVCYPLLILKSNVSFSHLYQASDFKCKGLYCT